MCAGGLWEEGGQPWAGGPWHLPGDKVAHPTWPGLGTDCPSAAVTSGAPASRTWGKTWDGGPTEPRTPRWGGDSSSCPTAPSAAPRWPGRGRDGCTSPRPGHRLVGHWDLALGWCGALGSGTGAPCSTGIWHRRHKDPAPGMMQSCAGGTEILHWVLWDAWVLHWGLLGSYAGGCWDPALGHWDPALGPVGSLGAAPHPCLVGAGRGGPAPGPQRPNVAVPRVPPWRALRVPACPRRSSPAWASATRSTRGGRAGRC